ncbi:MAG TPA: Mrp/NBP35 family ATP-binding protein [Xanthobacteraceae bacterium]|nr:Mrp/NBP35 family ATP-binding protein [Xanthobacteraceae bacterium]
MTATSESITQALQAVKGPDGKDIVSSGKLSGVVVTGGKVFCSLTVDAAEAQAWEGVRKQAEEVIKGLPGVASVLIALTAEKKAGAPSAPPQQQRAGGPGMQPAGRAVQGVPGVKAIIAVASGKGGVGKSTTAVNLALGLQSLGLKVGVLDADIYGPSMPRLLALKGKPELIGGRTLKPMEAFGLKVMSIGFLVDEDTPMIWRGPMVQSAITQMLREVDWAPLDVIVVDMPPGTGDAQLTLAQQVPLAGAVIVSTPQDLALIDARRGIAMFKRVDVPVLGLVENMSYFLCPHCGERSDIFGHGGARHEADRWNVQFLGEIPLELKIRETSDAGSPIVASDPEGPYAKIYKDIAAKVRGALEGSGGKRAAPRIVIES